MRIYLDHNATTPLRDEVVDAMSRCLRDVWGNPSSTHCEGAEARRCVASAREQVAACLGADPDEIVFTGGATEANNAVIATYREPSVGAPRFVTSSVEHPSVEAPLAAVEASGGIVTRVPVDADGRLDTAAFDDALAGGADLASLLWANNETGVVQDAEALAGLARERGVPVHLDSTQAVGKRPIDLHAMGVDYLSCSAHKLNGPKGVGCLAVRTGARFTAWSKGGGQERGLRGGTENVAGIVGFGVACELAHRELEERRAHCARLRDRLWDGIRAAVPDLRRNGRAEDVLANTLNVEFCGVAGEIVLQSLDLEGVSVSAGAACHSGSISPSRVLVAMGRSAEQARASLRFSVGHGVDAQQIDHVVALLAKVVAEVRAGGEM